MRQTVKVTFGNGDHLVSTINGTREEVNAYYLNQWFNVGLGPHDNMQLCVGVDFIEVAA